MNSQQIIEVYKEYISNEHLNYAILLNGQWGIGKTYFVKEVLAKENVGRKLVIISLFVNKPPKIGQSIKRKKIKVNKKINHKKAEKSEIN